MAQLSPSPLELAAKPCRIAAKLDQRMALVAELKTQITTSHAPAEELIEAIGAELTTHCTALIVESDNDQHAALLVAEHSKSFRR